MTYYIAGGRAWGDDEAVSIVIRAINSTEAARKFRESFKSYDPTVEDGPGIVYIDFIFDCGGHKPTYTTWRDER
jgi:hypothetical protein